MSIEQLYQLGEVSQRPRQAVDLVDDDDIDLSGADIVQQLLQVGSIGGPARVPAVIISRADQVPAGMGLALDVGGRGLILPSSELNSWSSPCSVETRV
jgi:hypothetical protein